MPPLTRRVWPLTQPPSLHVDGKEAIEERVVGIGQRNEALLHDAGVVDDDIDFLCDPMSRGLLAA
jgi:hypothetical protein